MATLTTNDLKRIFQRLDKNDDGQLSIEELNWLLQRIGVHLSLDELQFSVGKSSLDFDEFLMFCKSITNQNNDDENKVDSDLVEAFNVYDINGDGFISCEELQSVLSRLGLWHEGSGKDCRSMIRVFDTNLDGVLDFEEFKSMMLQTRS